jgi:shikimate kinase
MIVHRLKNGKQNRPLLKNKNLAEFVKEHLAERKPFYMKSKITVDADWLSRHNVSDLIKMIDQLK